LRGHASTAFRAPGILDSSHASTVVPTQLQIGQGLPSFLPIRTNGNPNLDNERALALSAGVVWTLIDELNLLGDFWYYQYKDRIGPEDPAQKVAAWQAAMASQGGACVTDSPGVVVNGSTCTVKEIDITQRNTRGTTLTNGFDFGLTVNLTGKTFGGSAEDWGTISVGAQGTYTLTYDLPRNAVLDPVIAQGIVKCDGTSPTSSCNVAGNRNSNNIAPPVPRLRANFPISWLYRGHTVGFIAHYTSPLDDDNDSGRAGNYAGHINPFFTMDVQYGYTVKDWIGESLTIRVGIINLADQAPPAVTSERWGYEPLLYDPRGRLLYAKLTAKF
jgi:iron complex outermembrane receptor protein